jgi:predicted peptidase
LRWPLILFLHGSTEKGDDIEIVRHTCLPAYLEQISGFLFIVISPQLAQDRAAQFPSVAKRLSIVDTLTTTQELKSIDLS